MFGLEKMIADAAIAGAEEAISNKLPSLVVKFFDDGFRKHPDRPLTKVGYLWAFALAMKKKWPDFSYELAMRWCEEEMRMGGISIGQRGFVWTARTAQEQANEYVATYAEH